MESDLIKQVRQFNRAVTQRVGALQDSYLSRGRPLGEARLIFEIGEGGRDVRDLRGDLNLDSAYLSRLLRSLEKQDLVVVERSPDDARVRRAVLTPKGKQEFRAYDEQSDRLAASMLQPLDCAQQAELVAAMTRVRRLLDAARTTIVIVDPSSPDARWCLQQYFGELQVRFEKGFDANAGTPAEEAEMTQPSGCFLVAQRDGQAIGCAALRRLDDETAEVKRMWTAPSVRGQGIASRMLRHLELMAHAMGYSKLRLDTNRVLKDAQSLYLRHGFVEIERYNDNPYAHFWFEKSLTAA